MTKYRSMATPTLAGVDFPAVRQKSLPLMRPWLIPVLMTMLVACGQEHPVTSAPESHEEALERQSALVTQVTTVLQTVEDEASAEQAAPRVEELSRELQKLAVQMNAMPPLSWEEQDRLTRERARSGTARKEAGRQMLKIEQYPVLQEAWKRGMQAAD